MPRTTSAARLCAALLTAALVLGASACSSDAKKAAPEAPAGAGAKADPAKPAAGAASAPGSGAASAPGSGPASSAASAPGSGAASAPAKPQGPLEATTTKKLYKVTLTPQTSPPPMNAIFSVTTTVTEADTGKPVTGAKIKLDATMPAHRHGMVTEPVHKEVGEGKYLSEGMKLHMPGEWVFKVDVDGPKGKDEASIPHNQPAVSPK